MPSSNSFACRLVGKKIGSWNVREKRNKSVDDDSGAFSSCYHVIGDDGRDAFLKAFNYQYAFEALGRPSVEIMKDIVGRFTYEKELLDFCRCEKLRRVVTAIDSGEYKESGELPVPYLVFETATGSLKSIDYINNTDLVWKLLAFHGVLLGVAQLHYHKIAHQDLKPSNILVFGGEFVKVADLGSAVRRDTLLPIEIGADYRHAPIELLYQYFSEDWDTRRYGADLFMLGGLLSFMVSGTNVLSLIMKSLPSDQQWLSYRGSYEDILPNILLAFHESMDVIKSSIPMVIQEELASVIYEMSYPIPEKRGNPQSVARSYTQFSLVRYITIIHRLAKILLYEAK